MEVRVHTRNAAVGDAARLAAIEKLGHAARIFEHQVGDIDVEVSEEHNPRLSPDRYRLEVTTNVAGHIVRIVSTAASPEAAVDVAVDRFNRQLKRLKERLIDRNRRSAGREDLPAEQNTEETEIVRIKQFVMKPMTVEEAMLQMELVGHDFYFFHNAASGRESVLYRRRDGRLGLIEPA